MPRFDSPAVSRRAVLALTAGLPFACAKKRRSASRDAAPAPTATRTVDARVDEFAALERSVGGRLGVCVLDAKTGALFGHRMGDRFGMCSTFKVLLAGLILREADAKRLSLDTSIAYSKSDMVPYAPVTSKRRRMRVVELAEAAQTVSDNVAANLLIKRLGGPAAFTAMLRATGDSVTRLDRYEPDMNLVPAGEVRDTTSPHAMAESVRRFVAGDLLTDRSRELLSAWMEKTKTGRKRLRAGLPTEWRIGNKTGTGIAKSMANKTNDVAVVTTPAGAVHIVSAYYESDAAYETIRDRDQAVLAEVGRLAAARFAD